MDIDGIGPNKLNKDGLRPGAGGKRLDKIERLDKNKKIDIAGQTT